MEEIKGTVEEIVFHNDENGYSIARIKTEKGSSTIVGCIPYIVEAQNLILKGEWVIHPKFGHQFKVETYEEIVPSTLLGIEKYLSSGVISGIGPVTAKKIVEKFGEASLDVLDYNIERLKEIEGIGDKKITLIYDSYLKQREIRSIMVFFQTYGLTPNQCVKVYKKFGVNSISTVKQNPYILTDEISGIGFKTSDRIAKNLGIDQNSTFRIKSGIKYTINQFCGLGNTYIPMDKLLSDAEDLLMVQRQDIENNIYESAVDGEVKVETVKDNKCVYTLPYYYCETGVTMKIMTLAICNYDKLDLNEDKEIGEFERANNIEFASSQKQAIKGALDYGIEIITGGPGTGKTTIINCIIHIFEKANLKVLMAAPTGRAAKRMTEATGRSAKTIHRLLEMGVSQGQEEIMLDKNEETPLECDVLIVDEASMIDIILMNNLLKAITPGTRILIVGDVDQLPSVGPGNVLRDLIDSKCIKVVRLSEIFRQSRESMIIVNAHKINNGEMPVLNKKDRDFYFIRADESSKILEIIIDLIDKRLPSFNKSWNKIVDIQVLSPMRKGILGVGNLNNRLQEVLNIKDKNKNEKEFRDIIFRVGDKVMQIKNNYTLKWTKILGEEKGEEGLGVFNGDVGYVEKIDDDDNTVAVILDGEKRVIYENVYLDELELAYAVTIHKSQGSEFPVIIIPAFMGPPLLMNRNLFYTGITRAKQLVVLVGSLKAINFMVSNNRSFERYSLLKWRIMNIIENGISED
jgi:exodeoxyribonuclease V alpha subunit